MANKKWRRCPFCGERPKEKSYEIKKDGLEFETTDYFFFMHLCKERSTITLRASSEEELRLYWNGKKKETDKSKV